MRHGSGPRKRQAATVDDVLPAPGLSIKTKKAYAPFQFARTLLEVSRSESADLKIA